ncbi:MAG: hypothetical protein JWP63_4194 [Candidatus Solibacter sp.]|nr:hypothetical protein [Candidatus Solibacter sp.]
MAIRQAAICLILAGAAWAQQFPVRHQHVRKYCEGTLTVDEKGITFQSAKHGELNWPYADIQQLTLGPKSIHILSYKDSSLLLGRDLTYNFTGVIPSADLYARWSAALDQRFVAALPEIGDHAGVRFPAKLLDLTKGTESTLVFGADLVGFGAHTWRYSDIQSIASSGPFQLTLTTLEKQFRFQLKQPISESTYNQLWLDIEKKNGRIQ